MYLRDVQEIETVLSFEKWIVCSNFDWRSPKEVGRLQSLQLSARPYAAAVSFQRRLAGPPVHVLVEREYRSQIRVLGDRPL